MAVVLETDKERDLRARDEFLQEYDGYGELGQYVRMLEEHVLNVCFDEYSTSRAQMEPLLKRWEQYTKRFRGEWEDGADDAPFGAINYPRIARMVDVHIARVLQTVIPDRMRMDFFAFEPEASYEGDMPSPDDEAYARAATNGVRNDMINANYAREVKDALWSGFVKGNAVMLGSWDLDIQYRYRRVPNPEFDPENPFRVDMVDGKPVVTPIQPEITVREPYREFDAPRIRNLNVSNVFPSELDKDNIEDCTAVSIYDTVRLADLLDNEISTGGYVYANLNRVMFAAEETDVPEIATASGGRDDWQTISTVKSSAKLDRVTRMGRFRIQEAMNDLAIPEEFREGVIEIVAEKYGWDKTKITGWNTWIVEMVSRGSVLVRWQPSPYVVDRKPIIHFGLFRTPNRTWAQGIYDRCAGAETFANAMERYRMELTLRMVRPMMFVDKSAIDNGWRQMHGDNYSFTPNGIVWLKPGKRASEALQFPNIPSAPLQYADVAQSQQALDMSEMGHLPPVKMGTASGGATASEVQSMGSSADIILQEFCLDAQDRLLSPGIGLMLLLHHQHTTEARVGYEMDPEGKVILSQVPPEVWTKQYRVNLLGFQQVGNLAVRTMNFNEYAKFLQGAGRANIDQLAVTYGKLLGIPNAGSMIAPAPEPPPPLQEKINVSYVLRPEIEPPGVRAKMYAQMGVELDEQDVAQMGGISQAQEMAAVYESSLERKGVRDEMDRSLTALGASAGEGGAPAGAAEAQPSNYMPGSHHKMGEQEQRQRGLLDDKGATASVSQRLRNPMNGRRANG